MAERGVHIINSLRQKWIACQLLADVPLAFACASVLLNSWFLLNKAVHIYLPNNWHILLWSLLSYMVIVAIHRPWRLSVKALSTSLNQIYPELEESAELMVTNTDELTLLQELQLKRVETAIQQIPALPKHFLKSFKLALGCLAIALVFNYLMTFVSITPITGDNILISPPNQAEKVLPQISSVDLTISPPAYTNKAKRQQDKFAIIAEEGASVNWIIHTNIAIKQLKLTLSDKEQLTLTPDANKTTWTATRIISSPGFYQVSVDGKLSDLYQIETIKDNPPQVRINTPKQYTYIDAGEVPKVNLATTITDDYGVADAMVYATVAKGSGEGVKFKEYKIPFDASFSAHKIAYKLQHLFDLPKLSMEPGDELYFYIEAQDNHQQRSRTDVFTVSIQDTAALLSMDGIVNGSTLKPEYFRSQRQIIMDTEKLLKNRDSLSKDRFNSTSGDIGIDQKMLRLRYGKFLGEEEESNVGGIANNDELAKAENFSNEAMIKDAITDKHDNAEDATYLDPQVKNQLRATLTEMWNAELHLRMYKPEEALPFEYKALRLLKDLQQKSRSYVAKTAYKPIPLKMEKRLSGELDKITSPLNKQEIKPGTDEFENSKKAAVLLEQLRITRVYSDADKHILQLAKQQLSIKASAQPGTYLKALGALNRLLGAPHPSQKDIDMVEKAIQISLPQLARIPQAKQAPPDMGLAQHYYQNLKQNK